MSKTWRDKLRILTDAANSGHPLLKIVFRYSQPQESEYVRTVLDDIGKSFQIEAYRQLHELYETVDGMIIAQNFGILGLKDGTYAFGGTKSDLGTLKAFNEVYLEDLFDANIGGAPLLILGLDDFGDALGLLENGQVVDLGRNSLFEPVEIAPTLDVFFNDICLGVGYLEFYKPQEDDFWLQILQEFGFVAP